MAPKPPRDYLKLRAHSPSPSYGRKGSPISVDHARIRR